MSGDYLADSPEHGFTPQDRLPDRCGFISDGMLCGYDRKCHEALWPREPAAPDDLADFLTDRYDEAEALALACADSSGSLTWRDNLAQASGDHTIRTDPSSRPVARIRLADSQAHDGRTLNPDACAAHIAANDPVRRLADLKLKRAILALHAAEATRVQVRALAEDIAAGKPLWWHEDEYSCTVCGWFDGEAGGCATVRQLGTEFAEHAAYRAEWRPE